MRIPLFPDHPEPLLFAHRGCSALAPENTLPAFRRALEKGVFGIELDIRRCGTGELVVIHDKTVDRTTDGSGGVEELSLKAIRELDAGSWFEEGPRRAAGPGQDGNPVPDRAPRTAPSPERPPLFRGERVPLLEEVFDLCGDRVAYDIEIKYFRRQESGIPRLLVDLIARFGLQSRVMVSSFNPLVLRRFRSLTPRIPTALIFAKHQEVPFYLRRGEGRMLVRCDALKPRFDQVTTRSVARWADREGYPLLPWTVDDGDEAHRLIRLGARGIISNIPEGLRADRETFPERP